MAVAYELPEDHINTLEAEIAQLKADLRDARLDLLHSDAIRTNLHSSTVDLAGSMARALALTEVAYYAGHEQARLASVTQDATTPEEGYRLWTESLKEPA